MNNWIFQIKLSGLTAFVMRPIGSEGGARVFLMNAQAPSDLNHKPELRFDVRDKQPSPWKIPCPAKDAITKLDPPFPQKKRWMLHSLDLNFLPAPGVALQQPFELDPSINTYLLRLTDIMPGAHAINPRCFDPVPPTDLVAVRVPVRQGKLTATTLAFEPFRESVECEFVHKVAPYNPGPRKQYCAIEVTLEFVVEKGPLTLIGVPFNGSSSFGIAFAPRAGKREVVVELENRPVVEEKTSRIGDYKEMDEDFSLHYELSLPKPCDNDRVVPLYDRLSDSFSVSPCERADPRNCILSRFADDPRA